MKKNCLIVIMVALIFSTVSCNSQNTKKMEEKKQVELKTEAEKAAYALGVNLGSNFQRQGLDTILNFDLVVAGLTAQINKTAQIKVEETEQILQAFFQKQQEEQQRQQQEAAKPKIDEGKKFLAENAKKKGIVTTASGLQYEVLKMGIGEKPKATSKVKVHYEGKFLNGSVFDSSIQRGEPIAFQLNGVIKGWTEGLQLMPVGSKFMFYIPYDLAYGEKGYASIGPYETLIFEVELLGIEK